MIIIIAVFTPSFSAVKLSPGTPNDTSVTPGVKIIFEDVNLTIRGTEAIPVNYLLFSIFRNNNNSMVAYVNFSLDGTKNSDYPANAFTLIKLTNTSNLPYNSTWGYGIDEDEENHNSYNFTYGYGYGPSGPSDLTILYNIYYETYETGTFYAKLFVSSTIVHTYASNASISFTVTNNPPPPPPPPPGGGGGEPSSNEPPVANANGPYTGYVNQSITFSGYKSTDDVEVTGYRWDWNNDGTYDTTWSRMYITSHIYNIAGVYTITLEVKDDENLTDSNTTTVTVIGTINHYQEPVADAAGLYEGLTYQNIQFDGSGSYAINASIVNYTWYFGDDTYGYGISPTHAYTTAGTFIVILTITDSHDLEAYDVSKATIGLDENQNGILDSWDQTIGVDITLSDLHAIFITNQWYYLVDTNSDGIYDTFYDPITNTKSILGQQDKTQLIDIDDDGDWDYIYDPTSNSVIVYKKTTSLFDSLWIFILIASVIVNVIFLIIWLYRTGRI